jgi:hypothetical protein
MPHRPGEVVPAQVNEPATGHVHPDQTAGCAAVIVEGLSGLVGVRGQFSCQIRTVPS